MEFAYIVISMSKIVKSKLKALIGYTLSIIIFMWFFINHSENWRLLLFGVFFLILNFVHVFTLLDIEIRVPISRKWYYILLTALTIGFLILLIKYL